MSERCLSDASAISRATRKKLANPFIDCCAASLKAQAVSLFKQSCFAQAAGIFANLSALASSISPPTSESTSFATAGYNNSALCYLKLNEWDKSMAASANCLALGDRLSGTSAAVVEAVLFKA